MTVAALNKPGFWTISDFRKRHLGALSELSVQVLKLCAQAGLIMDYMLKRWPGFARFLEDGRICLTNNAAERALRGIALGRNSWLFAGFDPTAIGRRSCTP